MVCKIDYCKHSFFTAHMIRASMNSIMKIDLTGTIQFGSLPVEILTDHFNSISKNNISIDFFENEETL